MACAHCLYCGPIVVGVRIQVPARFSTSTLRATKNQCHSSVRPFRLRRAKLSHLSPVSRPCSPALSVKNRLDLDARASRRAAFSDLHVAGCFLYSLERGRAGRCSAASHATHPDTKRRYQLGMEERVRKAVEKVNQRLYGKLTALHFRDSEPVVSQELATAASN